MNNLIKLHIYTISISRNINIDGKNKCIHIFFEFE